MLKEVIIITDVAVIILLIKIHTRHHPNPEQTMETES